MVKISSYNKLLFSFFRNCKLVILIIHCQVDVYCLLLLKILVGSLVKGK